MFQSDPFPFINFQFWPGELRFLSHPVQRRLLERVVECIHPELGQLGGTRGFQHRKTPIAHRSHGDLELVFRWGCSVTWGFRENPTCLESRGVNHSEVSDATLRKAYRTLLGECRLCCCSSLESSGCIPQCILHDTYTATKMGHSDSQLGAGKPLLASSFTRSSRSQ